MSCRTLAEEILAYLDVEIASAVVEQYFNTSADRGFTGAHFESFGVGGDAANNKDRFTPEDVVAVSMLAVTVTGRAAIDLLDRRRSELSALLQEILVDVDIHQSEARRHLTEDSAAADLWNRIQTNSDGRKHGVGPVTAAKLLARKRPRLLPVYDSVVEAALGLGNRGFWLPLHSALNGDEAIVERLREIRERSDAGHVSLLRVLDVCIWMRDHGVRQVRNPKYPDLEPLRSAAA